MTKKKILALLSSFWLTAAEIEVLAAAIALGMQSSMQASYRWSAHLSGVASEWFLPDGEKQRLQKLATEHAQGIAQTYQSDVERTVTKFLDAYEEAHGAIDDGAIQGVQDLLVEWGPAHTGWKAPQISQYSCGIGGSDGTSNFILDALNGDTDLSDDEIAALWVGVLPEDAATTDECAEWAGQMVHIENADTMPYFPSHDGCPHYITIINTA